MIKVIEQYKLKKNANQIDNYKRTMESICERKTGEEKDEYVRWYAYRLLGDGKYENAIKRIKTWFLDSKTKSIPLHDAIKTYYDYLYSIKKEDSEINVNKKRKVVSKSELNESSKKLLKEMGVELSYDFSKI